MRRRELPDELVQAATALIAERGPHAFRLREVARRARVSEAAPYWHFAGKEALLAAVAESGFAALATTLDAVRQRVTDPRRRLDELGVAYVRFALAHPAQIRLMFGSEIADKAAYPALKAAAERAYTPLVAAITEAQGAGWLQRNEVGEMAMAAWALVHGLSALLIDGQLQGWATTPAQAERLTRRVTAWLRTGLESAPTQRRRRVPRSRQS